MTRPPLAYAKPDAAAALGISVSKLERLIRSGDIPAKRLGAKVLVEHDALSAYIKALPDA